MKNNLLAFLLFNLLLTQFGVAQITNYGSTPYCTSFESGTLDANWYIISGSADGRIQIWDSNTFTWGGSTATAFGGEMWLGMDNSVGGAYVINEAWAGFDMTGKSTQRLKFRWAEWNDETEPQDGIYISDNGGTSFTKVLDLNGASYNDLQWYYFNLSLDSINTVHGLSFTSTYVIKFQQYDNYYFAGGNDGFLFDNVFVGDACMDCEAISVAECSAYTVPSGDETYTTTGIYSDTLPNVSGCDSIIKINLVITGGPSSGSTIAPVVCDTYTVPSGDETYTVSGSYTDTIQAANGCDSIITINLTINSSTSSSTTLTVCDNYIWTDGITYDSSGTYIQILAGSNGCDSMATLNLTVNTTPVITISSSDGVTLNASGATGTYDWIDCSDSSVVFSGSNTFTPTVNGDYAVIGTQNGCSDTSACFSVMTIGISDHLGNNIKIYPNPVQEYLLINSTYTKGSATIYDSYGRLVFQSDFTNQINVSDLSKGLYTIVIDISGVGIHQASFLKQ